MVPFGWAARVAAGAVVAGALAVPGAPVGGAVGIEMAQALRRFGSAVTVISRDPHLASREDPEAQTSYKRAIAHAAPILAERGVDLLLEPINTRNMPSYFLNDFAYTAGLIDQLGQPNVKLQFDVYHRQILHGDVTMAFRALQPISGHIQVASVPSRNEPDGEELNFPFLFAEFERLGYDGYIGCEYNPRVGTVEGLKWFQPYRRA